MGLRKPSRRSTRSQTEPHLEEKPKTHVQKISRAVKAVVGGEKETAKNSNQRGKKKRDKKAKRQHREEQEARRRGRTTLCNPHVGNLSFRLTPQEYHDATAGIGKANLMASLQSQPSSTICKRTYPAISTSSDKPTLCSSFSRSSPRAWTNGFPCLSSGTGCEEPVQNVKSHKLCATVAYWEGLKA